jgi:antitoxin ParD1/3/4
MGRETWAVAPPEGLFMESVSVTLSETLKEFVDRQVAAGGYGSADQYIQALLREAQKQKARERVEELLLEGVRADKTEMTAGDWEAMRQEIRDRHPGLDLS